MFSKMSNQQPTSDEEHTQFYKDFYGNEETTCGKETTCSEESDCKCTNVGLFCRKYTKGYRGLNGNTCICGCSVNFNECNNRMNANDKNDESTEHSDDHSNKIEIIEELKKQILEIWEYIPKEGLKEVFIQIEKQSNEMIKEREIENQFKDVEKKKANQSSTSDFNCN